MSSHLTQDFLKNHYLFTEAEFMRSLTTKLQDYGFQHFSYIRILDKNKKMLLTTDPAYSELAIQEEFYKFAFFGPPELYSDGLFLKDSLNLGDIKPALESHGIHIGFILIKTHARFVEHFSFGSAQKDPSLNNFIINNLDLFEETIQEFQAKAKPLLKKYENSPLVYPAHTDTTGLSNPYWPSNYKKTPFSKREQEVFQALKKGLSSKRIATNLAVSPRTIEKHIENMFLKTDCKSRFELIEKLK